DARDAVAQVQRARTVRADVHQPGGTGTGAARGADVVEEPGSVAAPIAEARAVGRGGAGVVVEEAGRGGGGAVEGAGAEIADARDRVQVKHRDRDVQRDRDIRRD